MGEDIDQVVEIMTVDRADIGKPHLLEQQALVSGGCKVCGRVLGGFGGLLHDLTADGQPGDHALGGVLARLVQRFHPKLG